MITRLSIPFLRQRLERFKRYESSPGRLQQEQLRFLLERGSNTLYGREMGMTASMSPTSFARKIPVRPYEELRPYINRMMQGEQNVLWPGKIRQFAQSAGTTDAKYKYIPVTDEALQSNHYKAGFDTVAMYIALNPQSRFFDGKSLIIGAGVPNESFGSARVAQLSGLLVKSIPWVGRLFRLPSPEIAFLSDFGQKIELAAKEAIPQPVTSFSGIPTTYLAFLRKVQELTGKEVISDIWPRLEVFIHGGISFKPYREQFEAIIPSPRMHYFEVYNASEGFFSMQTDFQDPGMMLMLDHHIYYEFIPSEEANSTSPRTIPLCDVELGQSYAMVISSSCGLWRYRIGDMVTFTSLRPYKIIIAGRTKHCLNLCGEELMVGNTDAALSTVCRLHHAEVRDYTVSAIYPTASGKICHQWMIEFIRKPGDMMTFAHDLDKSLTQVNFDYECKREGNFSLEPPELLVGRKGLFDDWLIRHNKLGGQSKIPRLSEIRDFMDELIEMNR